MWAKAEKEKVHNEISTRKESDKVVKTSKEATWESFLEYKREKVELG